VPNRNRKSVDLVKLEDGNKIPVLTTQSSSSLTRTHELASSNSKSWRSSIRLANSGSCFKLRFRLRASHSGRGRAVEEPEIVYTGTADVFVSFIVPALHKYS